MDFETGKLLNVARHLRSDRRKEYGFLGLILGVTLLPYAAAFWLWPVGTTCVVIFVAYFQVLITFATSTGTDTAHHIRFLLCGSNPIGMTGASSLLFGAVDSVFDWREDSAERNRHPCRFWLLTVHRFAMTPIGLVLMATEYAWDAVLMQRPSLVRHKWKELFALAYYHNLICPEKSNDIFYADMALARFQNDPYLYQWNRMRAMVFELKHYQTDVENGVGVAETNLLLQDDVAAYQTLKRLEVETIENMLDAHYADQIQEFPCPPTLAGMLVKNAQPIRHFLRMRTELLVKSEPVTAAQTELSGLLHERASKSYRAWHVLRILDANTDRFSDLISRHIHHVELVAMAEDGILRQVTEKEFEFSEKFHSGFEEYLSRNFTRASQEEYEQTLLQQIPSILMYAGEAYIGLPRSPKLALRSPATVT